MDDSEVDSPDRDLFGHDKVAQRIATRLTADVAAAPTMAVVGPLGSGKSTIRRLVTHRIRENPAVRIIDISAWPFDSPEAVVHGILQAIVYELGRHVNILPLVGLSNDYVTTIESSAGRFGSIARLLRTNSEPEQIVQRVSDVASATGLRFVLWIEDLERFSGGDQLKGEQRTVREVERLGPIRALLHLLDKCAGISVIVSDVSLRTRFDLAKIARFVEHPPAMATEEVWKVTQLLRDGCWEGHPEPLFDPTTQQAKKLLAFEKDKSTELAWLSSFSENLGVPSAISLLLRTPRSLKAALRITLETWDSLAGEIDLDSVLVASALRVARPDLFALVDEHVTVFRVGLTSPFTVAGEKQTHPVIKQIDGILDGEEKRTRKALEALLTYLFPHYPPNTTKSHDEYIDRPQALFVNRFADYWRRYLTQEPVDPRTSDQSALLSIRAWSEHSESDLVDRVIDNTRSDQIEQFVGQFQPEELCRLLEEVVERLVPQSAANWPDDRHAPGIVPVWRMMLARPPTFEAVFQTVVKIVKRAAATNLPLAHDVAYYFARSHPHIRQLMSDAQQRQVKLMLRRALVTGFLDEDAEARFLHAYKDGSPWLVHWILQLKNDSQDYLNLEDWPQFASTLLNLAESRPESGVPIVVSLITTSHQVIDGSPNSHRWVGQFEPEQATRLFTDYDRLMGILSEFGIPDTLDEQMAAHCRAAVDAAQAASQPPTGSS